jgi:NitT/TauT family transport system substrate-binding protein
LKGPRLLDAAAARKAFVNGDGLDSVYGSTVNADRFNVRNAVCKRAQNIHAYRDPALTDAP